MNMGEYMESELSGIFQLKLEAKNMRPISFIQELIEVRQILRIHGRSRENDFFIYNWGI